MADPRTSPEPSDAATGPRSGPASDRRMFVAAGALFVAVLLGAIAIAFLAGGDDGTSSTTTTAVEVGPDGSTVPVFERPSSLPAANSGRAPEDPGDPGGWEQTLVFVLMAGGMLTIGAVVFRGGRRTRARRAEWLAAAAPGEEERRRQGSSA
ncbi:MAG: hypothetical protein KF906_10130 [Actinobacteria bacterium]|nr:hypothetical protein [Actinomycetota bacterium]